MQISLTQTTTSPGVISIVCSYITHTVLYLHMTTVSPCVVSIPLELHKINFMKPPAASDVGALRCHRDGIIRKCFSCLPGCSDCQSEINHVHFKESDSDHNFFSHISIYTKSIKLSLEAPYFCFAIMKMYIFTIKWVL